MTPATAERTETMKEVADREAAEAEQEEVEEGGVKLHTSSEPGEQGIATQDEEETAAYEPPEPSDAEMDAAREVLAQLENRVREYGPERTVEALIQIIDILPEYRVAEEWPGDEDAEYHTAPMVARISSFLLRGCPKLGLSPKNLVALWRNKEKWTRNGHTVRGQVKSLNTRTRFLTDGKYAVVEINFHHFRTLNPLQKVFAIYHELRGLDTEAKKVAPDFEGYLDELEIFGTRVFREMVALENALERGKVRDLPHQLSLLEEAEEDGAAA